MTRGHGGLGPIELIVPLAAADTEEALRKRHTRIFDITGRPMKGRILVQPAGLTTQASLLGRWIDIAVKYASSRPAKK